MASQSTQPPATNPVPQELTNNDLALLLDTLNPVASKCFALGLQLGVNDSRIRNIKSNNSQCEDQLREIISERLRQESPLTWHDIARALRANSVSENRLASEIENKYIHHLPPPASVAPQANTVSLATSSLTSSLQSSSQCDTSPLLAHSSASVASTDTIVHIPLSKLPLKYSQHIQSISSEYPRPSTSASTVNTASANSECNTLISIPFSKLHPHVSRQLQSQSLLPSTLKDTPHKMMGSVTRPHRKCSAKTHKKRKVVSGSSGSITRTTVKLQLRGHCESVNEQMKVRERGRREIGSGEVREKKKRSHRSTTGYSMTSSRHEVTKFIPGKPSSVRVEKRGRGGPTTRAREELSSGEEEVVYQGTEQRSFSEFTSESDDIRQGRRAHEHTSESSSSSAENSASSSAEEEEGKRPDSRHVSRKSRRRRRLAMWSTPKQRKRVLKSGGRKGKGRQLQHTSLDHHSDQYLNDSDPPQSVRQVPGREYYQSEEGPQRPHLQASVTSSPILHSTSSQYSSPVNTGITPVVQQFIDYVKAIYRESEVERDTKVVKWPPTPSTVYINLACINRKTVSGKSNHYVEITKAMVHDGNVDVINRTKGPIEFSEIAKSISIPFDERNLILVEGAPGVGKSTFAREFCRRWERGEIAQQYQLVLLLRLRDGRISKAESLRDLIYHPSKCVRRAVTEKLMHSHHFHALIILEGFDELPDHCRNDQSIFFQLIAGKLLPLATVLVTSRPWATEGIRKNYENHIYQHIEILGFTSQQITEYIERTLPQDKVSDLKAYLEKHPQIRMGMYIPLNSAIVVAVYQESQESECALPTTLTELYTAMAQTLLVRYLRGHPQYETTTMKTFSDLPPAVYSKFSEVCKLAYRGIVGTSDHVQLIFTGLRSDFDSLGLMDSVTELYVTQGAVSSHNFLHLTFQEYFAAVHISTLSPAEQLEHFERHEEGRLKVVLRFLAGLNKLSYFSKENVDHFQPEDADEGSSCCMYVDFGVTTDFVNWVFEAQSSDVITLALEKQTVEYRLAQDMLPLDYYCLGYCIAHSQCQWVVWESFSASLGIEEIRMLVAGVNITHQPSGRVVGLRVGKYEDEVLNILFRGWISVLHLHELELVLSVPCDSITWPDLSALRILRLEVSGNTNWRLDTLLPHLSLESLTIQGYRDGDSLMYEDCVAIADHITSVACLKELYFTSYRDGEGLVGIDDKGLEAITKALADNQSLPLETLEFSGKCTFTDNAAEDLPQFISNTKSLQCLRIKWCTFSVHGLLALARAIHDNSTLQEMRLEELSYTVHGDDEAKDLAQLLVEYPQVEGRYEDEKMVSQIIDAGAVALAKALHHNSTLESLHLSTNSISDGGAVALAQALHHNSTLNWLDLTNNSISDAGAVALAQALHHNSTLVGLYLSDNSISA